MSNTETVANNEEPVERKKVGAPFGNRNAAKARHFFKELMLQCEKDPSILPNVVRKLLECAQKGEPWAIREVRDTMDGKPAQAIALSDPDGKPVLSSLCVQYVKPNVDNAAGET